MCSTCCFVTEAWVFRTLAGISTTLKPVLTLKSTTRHTIKLENHRNYLISKHECLYVCLYLIQIQISEPIGTKLCTHLPRGLEETVEYVWAYNILPFPRFRPILLGAGDDSYAVDGCWRHTVPLLRYIRDAACAGVTSRTVGCAMKTRRSERNACVWKCKPDETGRKWLTNCTCNYIAFIQMIT